MNVDSKVITVALFLIIQGATAVWWGSGLSSEVSRLAGVQGDSIPSLEAEAQKCGLAIHQQGLQIERIKELTADTSSLDVYQHKIDSLSEFVKEQIAALRSVDSKIMVQHEKIFDWMAGQGPMQQKGANPYN